LELDSSASEKHPMKWWSSAEKEVVLGSALFELPDLLDEMEADTSSM